MLLSLVRLRYRDTLCFMNVERVASSLEVESSIAAKAELPGGAPNTFTSGQVPQCHEAAGIVTKTVEKNGEAFDWNRIFENVLRIRTAEKAPETAAIAVPYRGHWLYIDDSDLDAKSTFALLSQLFALQAGTQRSSNLNLSFPIGRWAGKLAHHQRSGSTRYLLERISRS